MSKNVAKLLIALFFLSSLFVTSGQNRLIATQDRRVSAPNAQDAAAVLVPQISKYGSLVGLKDARGKNILKGIKHRWREGYAIAYQVKDSKGVYKDRFVYVMGDKVSARKLKVEGQKSTASRRVVTTDDKALEIGRFITWDKHLRALKSDITITNTSNYEVVLRAIEIDIDKSVATRLLANGDAWAPNVNGVINPNCPFRASITAPGRITLPASDADPGRITPPATGAAPRSITAPASITASASITPPPSVDCLVGDLCPPCPCVHPQCEPSSGQAWSFDREPIYARPVNIRDLIGPKLPQFKAPMQCLSWSGSNLSPSVLKPGEQIVVHYRLNISPGEK